MLQLRGREKAVGYGLMIVSALLILAPFLWIAIQSFKFQLHIFTGAWNFPPTLSNYTEVLFGRRSDFPGNVLNSIIIATASTGIVLVVGTLAAYSLSRLKWARWIAPLFLGWTLIFHMVPTLTLVGPWFVTFRQLGLIDTLTAVTLTHITLNLPMTVWLMMAFFKDIPIELEQAALVDGCRRVQAFFKVSLPLAAPGLIAAGIIAFVFSWNEFPVALTLTSRETATVPVAIARFAQQYEILHGQMAAASMISTVPALLLMLFGQRFVVQGLTLGAIK